MQNRNFTDAYLLRLPDGWRARIKKNASINHRSMNSEILAALEVGVNENPGADAPSPSSPANERSNSR